MFSKLKDMFRIKSDHERMNDFLSQAQSREHLEYLEREWDKLEKTRKY
jgi:hypothetical protein